MRFHSRSRIAHFFCFDILFFCCVIALFLFRRKIRMNQVYRLWAKKEIPLFNSDYGQDAPCLTFYPVKSDTALPCVIVFPGGAYSHLAEDHEGRVICELLNKNGFAAFVLRYRLAPYRFPCQELDAKRAVRFVRANADKFGIDPNKIGIMGFSAGGHLACMTGLRFDNGTDGDETDRVSSRPDNVCACYPVASLARDITHRGTRENLLGDYENDGLADSLTSEKIVPDNAPPFFIWHTAEDNAVDVRNSLRLANALAEKKKLFELHVFPYGSHGLGLAYDTPLASQWSELYINWLRDINSR